MSEAETLDTPETPADATVERESTTTVHDEAVHPCAHCAGQRTVTEYSWRSPSFWVECQGCGNAAVGETLDEAVDAWNAANPDRDVSSAEAQMADLARVQPLLTPDFLTALDRLTDVYEASETAQSFAGWCHDTAGKSRR